MLLKGSLSKKRLAASFFIASWFSNILTALAVGIEIRVYPLVGNLGGIAVTVPTMLFWYVPTGLAEGAFTSTLVLSLSRAILAKLYGLVMLKTEKDS
jgi:ABC-type Co2+ transport system permease subunit